jgi:hypothetical protein
MRTALTVGGALLVGAAIWDQAINPALPGYGVTTLGFDFSTSTGIADWIFLVLGLILILVASFQLI